MFSMSFNSGRHLRARKLEISQRRKATPTGAQRPITEVLEVKLENYVATVIDTMVNKDEATYRPLIAWSTFQSRQGICS